MLDEIDIGDVAEDGDGDSWFSSAGIRSLGSGAIFLLSIALLFWNEGYSKRHGDALIEVQDQVQVAPATLDPALNGKPVHVSARVHSTQGARDDTFGVHTDGPAMYRLVEMYQWIEYEETHGSGRRKRTTYTYEMDWDSEYWDSSQFHNPVGHENPKPALSGDGFFAPDARFGAYRFDNVAVARQALNELGDSSPGSLGDWPALMSGLPELSSSLREQGWFQLDAETYYKGREHVEDAELGDLRVSFYELSNDYPLSMIAGQNGDRLEPWAASNGDHVLLAQGGTRSAETIVHDAIALNESFTKLLRIVGLIGATIGAAGFARLLGGFLSMIPLVGALVDFSLMVAGALFGLTMGLITIVVGWLAARPWIAAVLLIAIGSAITWAVQHRRKADRAQRRSQKLAQMGELARQRAAERAQMPQAPIGAPVLAAAGAASLAPPPPPPASARTPASRAAAAPPPPPAPPPVEESRELPPLEWTPGLISTKPPSVRAKAEPTPPPPADDLGAIAFDTTGLRPTPRPSAAAPAAPTRPAAPAPTPPPAAPLFDTVEPRRPAPPLFDTVEPRQPSAPLFDSVEPRQPGAPLFDTVEPRQPSAPLFDLVEPRQPETESSAPPPATAAAPAPAAPAPPLRIALGSKGEYTIHKIVRRQTDGSEQLICFELTRAGRPIARGSQEEVKQKLKALLAAG
ncbi:MAG: TMEM43 family protein [Lysobacterales bacterium]